MKAIRYILTIIFFIEGITKLLALPFQVASFIHWGYTLVCMYIIGALEVLGALGLNSSKLRFLSTLGLLGLMIGAFATHIYNHDPVEMMGLAVIASMLLIIIFVKQMHSTTSVHTVK